MRAGGSRVVGDSTLSVGAASTDCGGFGSRLETSSPLRRGIRVDVRGLPATVYLTDWVPFSQKDPGEGYGGYASNGFLTPSPLGDGK